MSAQSTRCLRTRHPCTISQGIFCSCGSSGILLLKGYRETLKECFVQHVGADKATIIRTFTFGVSSCNDLETTLWCNPLTNLLQEDSFSFEDGLKTKDFVRCKVNLIKEQDSTALQGLNNRTVVPNGFSIDKTETANKVVFVSFNGDVDSDEFSSELGTRLLHRERLTVARETRNERRVE